MIWLAPLLLWAPTLFDQSVVHILIRDFPQAQFVLVGIPSREVLGSHWTSNEAIPLGSLVKPFTALALGRDPGTIRCRPSECWLESGHGDLGLTRAIAESCNSYFLQMADSVSADQMQAIATRFGLPAPQQKSAATWIGVGSYWQIRPTQMALAYADLAYAGDARGIRDGMRLSARSGTSKLLQADALAKTGTAPCRHRHRAPGDGYVSILYPPDAPKYVLLVQVHGVSGAEAARTAGAMLNVLRNGK